MNFPSVNEIYNKVCDTFKRFPLAMLFALITTILAIYVNHYSRVEDVLMPYVFTALFGFGLSVAGDTFSESRGFNRAKTFAMRGLVVILSGVLYFSFFRSFHYWNNVEIQQLFTIFLIVVFLIIAGPFLRRGEKDLAKDFWQYVVIWTVNVFFAALYFGLLFLGVVALLSSVDYLFDFYLNDAYYFDSWLMITGLFVSTFVLAAVPKSYDKLAKMDYLPMAIEVLMKYLLMPLVGLYLVVLYVYGAKIIFTAQWPKGGVASWIVGYSFLAVLVYFYCYFMSAKKNTFLKYFRMLIFPLLGPLVLLLFAAVGIRIEDYGFTPLRYLGVVYGIWLLLIAAVFTFGKLKDLRIFPLSLIIFLLVATWGPFSAFEVSADSQLGRLQAALLAEGVLVDGQIVPQHYTDNEEWSAIDGGLMYLAENDRGKLKKLFGAEFFAQYEGLDQWVMREEIMSALSFNEYQGQIYNDYLPVETISGWDTCPGYPYCDVDVTGYSHFVALGYVSTDQTVNFENLEFTLKNDGNFIGKEDGKEVFTYDLRTVYQNLSKFLPEEIDQAQLEYLFETSTMKGKFIFNNFNGYSRGGILNVNDLELSLLYNKK